VSEKELKIGYPPPSYPSTSQSYQITDGEAATIGVGVLAAGGAFYLLRSDSLEREIERICGKGLPPEILREIVAQAQNIGGQWDMKMRVAQREQTIKDLCRNNRARHRSPLQVVVSNGAPVENGASRALPPATRGIQWEAGLKTFGYGLLTLGAAAVTFAAGVATVGTIIDPIPGDEVALGASTAAMAGITAAAATTFYFSAQEFLKSIFN